MRFPGPQPNAVKSGPLKLTIEPPALVAAQSKRGSKSAVVESCATLTGRVILS
jgi:hypothetical protein